MDTANLLAMESVRRRISNFENLIKGLPAPGKAPVQTDKQIPGNNAVQAKAQVRALNAELRLRTELARAEELPGNYLEIAKLTKKLNEHMKTYPHPSGARQVTTDPCFACRRNFKVLQSELLPFKEEGKRQRRKERLALIGKARASAARMPEGDGKRAILGEAENFARLIDAAEKATLSRDAYHHTDPKIKAEGAPAGYMRGSEHPEILRRYGITPDMLAPPKSGFRAELYIPDPTIFGNDAKPVLVFKGTSPTCIDDVATDMGQAKGKANYYYKHAVELGKKLKEATNGRFETAGHSLGGGMASAVSIVTGCSCTVYNPAGLHPNMVLKYTKTLTDASKISAFVVKGEAVNASQDTAVKLGNKLVLASTHTNLPILSPARLVPLAIGGSLSSVPTQVGRRFDLPSSIDKKTPNPITRHLMTTVIASIEQEKTRSQSVLKDSLPTSEGAPHAKGMA